ncbi:LURP1-related protein domain containing protein [Trema orientale]|uniref:LURP1-related protein domain containing protein n=1 Tax=Trema orientale TaxID=63057 RepID=A0A2P5F9B4_TREOI|nr:LURP1-related protein domain containing protein [Trema orientale]
MPIAQGSSFLISSTFLNLALYIKATFHFFFKRIEDGKYIEQIAQTPKRSMFSAKKSSLIQFRTELDVFLAANTKEEVPDFKVKGSWFEKSCTIYISWR